MIYKHYKQSPTNILNDQIHYKSYTLFDTIKHSSHNNISAISTTMNRNIAASSTGTIKHWKWCTWHQKVSAKNSSKLKKFLHSEVNQLIQHIAFSIALQFSRIFSFSSHHIAPYMKSLFVFALKIYNYLSNNLKW